MDVLKCSAQTIVAMAALFFLLSCSSAQVAEDQKEASSSPSTGEAATSIENLQSFSDDEVSPASVGKTPTPPLTCPATDEYIATHKFLRDQAPISLDENTIRKLAGEVSRYCEGATERFKNTLILMTDLGVGLKPSLEISLKMAADTRQTQTAFVEILKSSYLTEYLDFSFKDAINLAYRYSVYAEGNPSVIQKDFTSLVRFCKDQQSLGLPLETCAQYAVELSKVSIFFPDGLFDDFLKVYNELRKSGRFALSVKDSLKVTYDILSYGPLAADNFIKSFDYAEKHLSLAGKDALDFALDMAGRSLNQGHPLLKQERFAGYLRVPSPEPTSKPEIAPLPGESHQNPKLRNPAESTEETQL